MGIKSCMMRRQAFGMKRYHNVFRYYPSILLLAENDWLTARCFYELSEFRRIMSTSGPNVISPFIYLQKAFLPKRTQRLWSHMANSALHFKRRWHQWKIYRSINYSLNTVRLMWTRIQIIFESCGERYIREKVNVMWVTYIAYITDNSVKFLYC
jgi:hypothetical protein